MVIKVQNYNPVTGPGGFTSDANYREKGRLKRIAKAVGGGLKKTGKGVLATGRVAKRAVISADKTQRVFKSEYYNRRKLALERKENVVKHKANISGLKAQRAQSKADYLEARHKQYQVRQQARIERAANRSTSRVNFPKYNPYGKGQGFFGPKKKNPPGA